MLKMNLPTEGLSEKQSLLAHYVKMIYEKTSPDCIGDARHFVQHVIHQFQGDLGVLIHACLSHEDTPTH